MTEAQKFEARNLISRAHVYGYTIDRIGHNREGVYIQLSKKTGHWPGGYTITPSGHIIEGVR